MATPVWIALDERAAHAGPWLSGVPKVLSTGVLPFAILLGALAGFAAILKRRHGAATAEAIQAIVVLLAVAFAILTLTGVWFRGEGMALTWPWGL